MANVYELKGKKINIHIDEALGNQINRTSSVLMPEGFRSFASVSDCRMCEEMGMKKEGSCNSCYELFKKAKAGGMF